MAHEPTVPHVDAEIWPGVAAIPSTAHAGVGMRALLVRRRFNRLISHWDGLNAHTFDCGEGTCFARIAEYGWVGLLESFLAKEWTSTDLPQTLKDFLAVGLDSPVTRQWRKFSGSNGLPAHHQGDGDGGQLPTDLVALYTGDQLTAASALFATGVRTSIRKPVESYVAGAGRRGIPQTNVVELTDIADPDPIERADLADAQTRRIDQMLDAAQVQAGDRVLEWPSSGGELAIRAAERGATVTVMTADPDEADAVIARFEEAGLSGAIRIVETPTAVPSPREFSGMFDCIFSVERVETLGRAGLVRYLRAADRLLADDGVIVLQNLRATSYFDAEAGWALDTLRAYLWPQLWLPTAVEVRQAADKYTSLRVSAESRFPGHYVQTIRQWQSLFEARQREAAGLGFDRVYRRLWTWYFALMLALLESGRIDVAQTVLQRRNRPMHRR